MRDVLEVRRALEVLAVSLSCDRISGEQIEALKEAAEEFDRSLTSDDVTRTQKQMSISMILFTARQTIRG